MDALTGKASHDHIGSFFLFIDMDALTGKAGYDHIGSFFLSFY
jgi:hypothetical protein